MTAAQTPAATDTRKSWHKPEVTELRAGSAENTPGTAFLDGPLETLGS